MSESCVSKCRLWCFPRGFNHLNLCLHCCFSSQSPHIDYVHAAAEYYPHYREAWRWYPSYPKCVCPFFCLYIDIIEMFRDLWLNPSLCESDNKVWFTDNKVWFTQKLSLQSNFCLFFDTPVSGLSLMWTVLLYEEKKNLTAMYPQHIKQAACLQKYIRRWSELNAVFTFFKNISPAPNRATDSSLLPLVAFKIYSECRQFATYSVVPFKHDEEEGKCNSGEQAKKTASLGFDHRQSEIMHAGSLDW